MTTDEPPPPSGCPKTLEAADDYATYPKNAPAYRVLAMELRKKIASGEYPLGQRIPSESAISRERGLSTMTVRQSVGLLVQAGVLNRVQGSGTFVVAPAWTRAQFGLSQLAKILEDRKNLTLCVFKARLASAGPKTAAHLKLDQRAQVIFQDRLILHKGRPVLLNYSALKFDPLAPVVEAELEHVALFGVLAPGQAQSRIKKSLFKAVPAVPGPEEAARLRLPEGEATLKISYDLYDFDDRPFGSGWLLAPRKLSVFSSRLGFWDDEAED